MKVGLITQESRILHVSACYEVFSPGDHIICSEDLYGGVIRLHETVNHGIYGYSQSLDDYYGAAVGWFEKYFDWKPEQRWLVKTPQTVR